MANDSVPVPRVLPLGDDIPGPIYVSVGRSIHAWEGLEQAFARLFLKFKSLPDNFRNLADYGNKNRRFIERKAAIAAAAAEYFVKHPNQEKEGGVRDLLEAAELLSIERHRIAHGQASMGAKVPIPSESAEVEVQMRWRWSAPWYSAESLRTDIFGKGSAEIEQLVVQFEQLQNRVDAFSEAL